MSTDCCARGVSETYSFFKQKLLSGCLQTLHFPHWGLKSGMTLSPGEAKKQVLGFLPRS